MNPNCTFEMAAGIDGPLRNSGLKPIGDVPWGTHFCQLYASQTDLVDTLVPYFKAGLEANEFCMWVTSEPLQTSEAEAALRIAVPELDRFLSDGQIEILDYSQWYMLGGKFDADRVLQGWFGKLDAARKRGFEGLRVSGNVFWEEADWEDYTHYEAKVNDVIGSTRMLALCTCSLEKYRPREVLDVVSSHEFALLREGGRWELLKNIARRKAERTLKETLRESEERYRQLVEQMNDGIFVVGSDRRYVDVNPAGCAMLGMTREEVLASSFHDVLDPQEHKRLRAKIASLADGKVERDEWRFRRKDGSVFIGELLGRQCPDGRFQGVVRDITERRRQEEHIHLLMREVNHRSKNMLSLVQAIARQTAAVNPNDFLVRFEDRIQALASGQDLMVKNEWRGANLDDLVRSQLAHFEDLIGTRIELQGPPIFVTASAAQALGMTLHELATNAGKYGALANGDGRVAIGWDVEGVNAGGETFTIWWREQGDCRVTPPSKRGFGSTVICEMAELSLGAKVDLDFPATGLIWRLQCPAGAVLKEGSSIPAEESERPAGSSPVKDARPRVLVVEDEAVVAIEIAQMLIKAGFEVVGPARAVNQALRLVNEAGCDAAIIDIKLGSETSEPVALGLKERAIPFVTVSGYSREQLPPVFSGIRTLTKPLPPELLVLELRRCMEQGARTTKERAGLAA